MTGFNMRDKELEKKEIKKVNNTLIFNKVFKTGSTRTIEHTDLESFQTFHGRNKHLFKKYKAL